jgi:hypothetical protein
MLLRFRRGSSGSGDGVIVVMAVGSCGHCCGNDLRLVMTRLKSRAPVKERGLRVA